MEDATREQNKRFITARLADPNKAEAMSWLSSGPPGSVRTLGEMESNEASVAFVRRLYDLGAVEVLAVEIDTDENGDANSGALLITLPDDPVARERLFGWSAQQAADMGFDGYEDFGQRHLFVMLD